MKAFELDDCLIDRYSSFSRSFTRIRSDDLRSAVDHEYDAGRFWPDSLLSINPRYESGPTIDELVANGELDPATGKIFRFGETPLKLHRHQAQALAKARSGRSFVVTTGTGSGKSLCFFVPIVDAIVRALRNREPRRTRAIIVYPMNALANSQIKEIDKFIGESDVPEELRPRIARYTGQEDRDERNRIAKNPPDILLTNFMMAELLLTRQDELDSAVIANSAGLDFIVLDELHTYRGRQGADVAVLVRRLRNRCSPNGAPICIGTSATMASDGSKTNKAKAVADVASRLFGTTVGIDAVIDESLQRATDDTIRIEHVKPHLSEILTSDLPDVLTNDVLRKHPLAVWVELAIGLIDGQELRRQDPMPFSHAVEKLSEDSGVDKTLCREAFVRYITRVSLPETERGGTGKEAFLAFKLHRFISGAGEIFTTLTDRSRRVLFQGQLEDPESPGNRLYPTRFCRSCGHEVHVVTKSGDSGDELFLPRSIDDTPRNDPAEEMAGYLVPVGDDDPEYRFDGSIDSFPEDWKEEVKGIVRLRANRKERIPQRVTIGPDGRPDSKGTAFWFIPGKFGFCPCCHQQPHPSMRERSKLAGLSGEGRSSATTLLVSTILEWMNGTQSTMPPEKRKLLGFTDNRQDAALQAGHFNDFLFVSLLRGSILRAILDAGIDGVGEEDFGLRTVRALGFTAAKKETRAYWMLEPESGAVVREDAQRALAKVLAHRFWIDLRRGWRYTNPSLSELGLIEVCFVGLDDVISNQEDFDKILPSLGSMPANARKHLLEAILKFMLQGMAVNTEALDRTVLDTVSQKSRNLLRAPWAIDTKEQLRGCTTLLFRAPGKDKVDLKEEQTILRGGVNSSLGRMINRRSMIGSHLKRDEYLDMMNDLMELLASEGLVVAVEIEEGLQGWRLAPSTVRIIPGPAALGHASEGNSYFFGLYSTIAEDLKDARCTYWGLEGREHTAQVSSKQREWREWRFRFEADDLKRIQENAGEIKSAGESTQFLPALFCSPTMELGVDISALNAVYLRNVPPTPANYAQRAGRAGRSGQAAVIVTYCAAQSPHDQYFFTRRSEMVSGVVRPPALDITNEELIRSHLHAVWLAESKLALSPDIPEILDLSLPKYPLKPDILGVIKQPALAAASIAPMRLVLDQILASVGEMMPVWLSDRDEFIQGVAMNAPDRFDQAFQRWRELYHSARSQLAEANARSMITSLSKADRQRIKAAQMQATDQIAILEQGKASNGSDFYSYRYLATEGFLPGYNFPRLPLYAFIPGEGKPGSFLQRARFLAISEFGPRSLIYHEGRAYRVIKAKLPPEVRSSDGADLATKDIFICPNCGACHDGEVERCHACDTSMAGQIPIQRTLRIDNVEAAPADRITANDEERVRQGFDIQTVFSWPRREGRIEITEADFRCGEKSLLTLQYANSAEISRINKGLKEQTLLGFNLDPRTGYWTKTEDEEEDADTPPDAVKPVRIVPIVRDRKNSLLLRLKNPDELKLETIATVQHALLRGIEIVFQLEEGEILGEPLPSRDERRAILTYEAAEGGAGVLGQLIEDPNALPRVARTALSLMHYDHVDEAIAAGDASLLVNQSDSCVRGCYRCLLSYYNQPDHEKIDRTNDEAKQLLIDIARGARHLVNTRSASREENGWVGVFKQLELPLPDPEAATLSGQLFPYVWRLHRVAAIDAPLSEAALAYAEDMGWTLFELQSDTTCKLPEAMITSLKP
jgi:Lhr-like helicase